MRGIRIKLSVFEYDVLKDTLEREISKHNDPDSIGCIALCNILEQFKTKISKATKGDQNGC